VHFRILKTFLAFALFVWPLTVTAQTVSPVGSPDRLDVATWNIEWFGSTSNGPNDVQRQFDNVRAIIEGSEIDLWSVQEISNPALFQALLDSLGDGFGGTLATYSQTQKIGFVYRTEVVDRVNVGHILESFNYAFAGRPPLVMSTTVTLPDTSLSVTFVTVHMKCCSDVDSYDRRVEAGVRLKNHIDFLRANESAIVLGDFNDRLTTSITPGRGTPYQNYLDDTARYRFVTKEAEERGETSFIGSSRSMIDHILITAPLFDAYVEESAQVWSDLTRTFIGFGSTTSDHLPVYASFDFRTVSSVENDAAELPATARIERLYPNPSSGPIAVDLSLDRSSAVYIDVLDVTGRQIEVVFDGYQQAGSASVSLNLDKVSSGLYLVRVRTAGATFVRPITILR
jgi:hypothetical protein